MSKVRYLTELIQNLVDDYNRSMMCTEYFGDVLSFEVFTEKKEMGSVMTATLKLNEYMLFRHQYFSIEAEIEMVTEVLLEKLLHNIAWVGVFHGIRSQKARNKDRNIKIAIKESMCFDMGSLG